MWSFFSRDPSKDFNYEILESVKGTEEFMTWKLHKGKKKGTADIVSIFVMESKASGNDIMFEMAKSAVKRLKTLRHPNILTFIDSLETDKCIYLVTEYVEPLQIYLSSYSSEQTNFRQRKELFTAWGLFQITRAISFLNNDCSLQHNSISHGCILVNSAGEWKLGGFEYAAPPSPNTAPPLKVLPSLEKYYPPEQTDTSKLRYSTNWSVDMWGLGCLIWEVFNGTLKSPSSLKSLGNIPKPLTSVYCELVGANPSTRPNPKEVIAKCSQPGGYFQNDLVDCLLFLEEIQIKEANEKSRFFTNLPPLLDSFPENLSRFKILPQLINAFEFGNAGSSILSPMFKLGSLLSEQDYQKQIVPCVVKLFSSPDRATRVRLLQQLEHFGKHLLAPTVNDQIFPHIANGFIDSNPVIREHTVKSILFLAPKLNYNNLNVEVLKHFARLQAKDEQGGIRTNTTVCLGKVASFLHPQVRQKVLVSAFTRALKDPFAPARIGGIMALAATQHYYTLIQISQMVLPSLCNLTYDPEREVRDQAFKVIKGFLSKMEKVSEDPSLKESMEADVNANPSPNMTEVASTWAGWAVSAVTSKFYKSPVNSTKPAEGQHTAESGTTIKPAALPRNSVDLKPSSELRVEQSTDNDTNWDSSQWGDMNSPASSSTSREKADGWDVEDEEWAPFEVTAKHEPTPSSSTSVNVVVDYEEKLSLDVSSKLTSRTSTTVAEGWDTNWSENDVWQAPDGKEESRKKREEKRIQRQKEIESKRKGGGGALKLGGKKLNAD